MKTQKIIKIHYPWLSILLVFLLAVFFLMLSNPTLLVFYQLPVISIPINHQLILLFSVSIIVLWDIQRFNNQHRHYEKTISELFQAKRQLQNKVHAYSSHSDQLKLFISERLLEYIQYDEKFLHFKNIAAEIRHNGVICFDQVQSILNQIIERQVLTDPSADLVADSEEALESMRYLWDLLDLSTADNIALHIGNHLCECEEYYFQSVLHKNNDTPYEPTFKAHQVLLHCLMSEVENPISLKALDQQQGEMPLVYNDSRFYLILDKHIDMLGKANHLRLLVENLISNAQFYLAKKSTVKVQKPIAIELNQQDNAMQLTVYNHGQHIKQEHKEKIFQLGYSTRRKKENHGKGLGLYFANNIAQGYEGRITFDNVNNVGDIYSIRIVLNNAQIITEIIDVSVEDLTPLVAMPNTNEKKKNIEWRFTSAIVSVEVFSKHSEQTSVFSVDENTNTLLHDSHNVAIPRWCLSIKQKKRASVLQFNPLDITGVRFQVSLPTAQARLDYSDEMTATMNEDADLEDYDNIIQLEKHFKD